MWLTVKFGKPDTHVIYFESCNTDTLALQSACAKLRAGYRVYEIRWYLGSVYMTEKEIITYCRTRSA